ncbi:MAG: response regulator [Desulfocapsaceae bacterium]|nr:response regulator [Desulfocapsaceae bacterium]
MTKRRILFVDDDPNILSGIRRVLRPLRDDFELQFAESGREALKVMEGAEFAAVVSDMRMPGMDGADLLKKVQFLYPCTIRIMLTGQADEDAILRTVGVVHQFLEKPSDPELLKSVLLRASVLYTLIADEKLKEIISGIESLPSLPEVFARLQRALVRSDVSVADVAAIIEEDMAMSVKVLQLVNSAFFGLFQQVESPARAVGLLGLETIKGIVLGMQIFSEMKSESKLFSLNKLWAHSLTVGACAKKIALAEIKGKAIIDHCFIAGILHDVGKLIFASKMSESYDQVVTLARQQEVSLYNAEKEVLHAGHDAVGAYLIGLWGLPGPVVEAIGFHHRVIEYPGNSFNPALAVHVANSIYYEQRPEEIIGAASPLDYEYLEKIGLAGRIDEWRKICAEILNQE